MSKQVPDAPQTSYYAQIIYPVLDHKNLDDGAKLLYARLSALCNENGYSWASNAYLAEKHNVEVRTIQRWLTALQKYKFIHIHISKKKFITTRKIFTDRRAYDEFKKSLRNDIPVVSNNVCEVSPMSSPTCHPCHPINISSYRSNENEHYNTPLPNGGGAASAAMGGDFRSAPDEKTHKHRVSDPPKSEFGSHVRLTETDYESLCKTHTKDLVDLMIVEMNDYCAASRPKGYADYAAAIRSWMRKRKLQQQTQASGNHKYETAQRRISRECTERWMESNGNPNDNPTIMRFK